MQNAKKTHLVYILLTIALLGFLLFVGAYQTKKILKSAFADQVFLVNRAQPFRLSYESIHISFFRKTFQLKNVLLVPDTYKVEGSIRPYTAITSLSVSDFQVLPLLFKSRLKLGAVDVEGFRVVYKTGEFNSSRNGTVLNNDVNPDKKRELNNIYISEFNVKGYQIAHVSGKSNTVLKTLGGEFLSIRNIVLENRENSNNALTLDYGSTILELKNQTLVYGLAEDRISIENIIFDLGKGYGNIEGFVFGDKNTLKQSAANKNDNKPVNAFDIPKVDFYGVDLPLLLEGSQFFTDSIVVRDGNFAILKDKRKPWDKNSVIPMPQEMLRNSAVDFWLGKVRVSNASLDYTEVLDNNQIHIPLRNINTTVTNIGTLDEGYKGLSKPETNIQFDATVFKDINLSVDLALRDPLHGNQFFFTGSTDAFVFESFNPVLVPSTSIKFESGRVSKIEFSGTGNQESAKGDLVMYFNDLKTMVLKRDMQGENKVFSFLANKTVRKENPKNGKLITARMSYDRRTYKGFPNYLVKTIESGLINSVYPLGKREKTKID